MAKKRMTGLAVAGFEYFPDGQLLTQFVDFDHSLGVAYERCIGYEKDFHTHDRLNLAFPRGSAIISFTLPNGDKHVVDEGTFLWLPAEVPHQQATKSTVYDNLALFPDETGVARAVASLRRLQSVRAVPKETLKSVRTPLLRELLERFFFERVLQRRKPKLLAALGQQILEETIRIVTRGRAEPAMEQSPVEPSTAVVRAVQHLEANLFAQVSSAELARVARVSSASLFRHFHKATGMTPGEYVRKRRLDEAHRLLKTGDYTASDVAVLVGYEELAAFSKAFKRQFGVPPSKLREGR